MFNGFAYVVFVLYSSDPDFAAGHSKGFSYLFVFFVFIF